MLKKYVSGGADPSRMTVIALTKASGVCLDWLAAGTGPMYEKDRPEPEPAAGSLPGDFVVVPMMQGKISAGGGLVPDTTIEMTVAFRREWLGRKGDHHTMSVIRVQGDSMAPTLLPGDVVLINHGITTVAASGGIYAITLRDEILIKRVTVEYPGERLVIISDNSRYAQSYADPGQVIINGKVVWYGRDLER